MERLPNPQLQALKDFLNLQSTASQPPRQCQRCGSAMDYFNFQFWFSDTEQDWNIPVPFCSSCEPVFAGNVVEIRPH